MGLFTRALYRRAREFRFLREQVSSLYTFGHGLFRYYYLTMGNILVQRGWLDDAHDVFYLTDTQVKSGRGHDGTGGWEEAWPDDRRIREEERGQGIRLRWCGKKHGNIERVIPPYTALIRQDNAVACLGREYVLDALGLPTAIRSAGSALLAAPARIVVTSDGKETVIPIGNPRIVETQDWRVRFEGDAQGAGLKFAATGWVEQDGLVYLDLTYQPAGTKPVKVDALRLEYPLAEADADSLLCIGPGENFSSRTTVVLPKDKTGRLWSTLDTGITGSGMTIGSFYPTVWIGSERRGFLWWADTGLLTSQQSRGVIRRPTRSSRIQSSGGVPRWA